MDLKTEIIKILETYGCLQKHKNEGVGEVYNQIRNEDLVNNLFALYGVVKSFYCRDEENKLAKKCNHQCEMCMLLDSEV